MFSLDQFVAENADKLEEFRKLYNEKHKENPEHYPLALDEDNAGMWLEFYMDFLINGRV